jgi:hypothetical protein
MILSKSSESSVAFTDLLKVFTKGTFDVFSKVVLVPIK